MDLIQLAVSPERELGGAEVFPWNDETMLLIARYNNQKFRAMQARLLEPYIRKQGRKGVTDKQAEKILVKCMAKTILLGWENLKVEGQLVEYSEDKAIELLSDPRLADFKEIVMFESQSLEHYRLESLEEDLGNLEASSVIEASGQ